MKVEDLFKNGVTPKEGPRKGERFEVDSLDRMGIFVYDAKHNKNHFDNGTFDLWQPPKTLFADDSIEPTWGNLKKAVEAAGLGDDTLFVVPRADWFSGRYLEKASFGIEKSRKDKGDCTETFIVVG